MEKPLVSVVMPSFNQAQFIEASVAGVLGQSYQQLELVVVDGASTDGTQAVLARLQAADRRVRWVSEPDLGPADALNKGFAKVRGTLVGWLNSDDLYTAGALERAVAALCSERNLTMVYGHAEHIDALGQVIDRYDTRTPEAGLAGFATGCYICQPTVFFKRTFLRLLGNLDTTLQTAFDFDYWLRAFSAMPERIGFVDAVQAQSRLHAACLTQKMRRTVALEGAMLTHKYLGRAQLGWVVTHFQEAHQAGQADLEQYFRQLVDDASAFYTPEEVQALQRAAQLG